MGRTIRLTNDEKIAVAAAEVLGQQAFVNGVKAIPALDSKLMKLVADFSTSDFSKSHVVIAIMERWSYGWHTANLVGDFQ